jgi:two-component system heavy metal sensor histidine kinase CusS
MPSLRRSLIAYFLVLLGLALLGYALVIDRFANETLRARQASEALRIRGEHDRSEQDAEEKFNDALLAQAKTLSGELRTAHNVMLSEEQRRTPNDEQRRAMDAQRRTQPHFNTAMAFLPLGTWTNSWSAVAALGAANHRSSRNAFFWSTFGWPTGAPVSPSMLLSQFAERLRESFEKSDHPNHYQIHVNYLTKQPFHSKGTGYELPLDTTGLTETGDKRFDDVEVPNLGRVRRVVYRSYLSLQPRSFGGGGGRGPNPGPGLGGPPNPGQPGGFVRQPSDLPPVYVQYAQKLTDLDAQKAALAVKRDEQIHRLDVETRESQERLRGRVAGIAALTFASLVVGGWFIIGIGLSPLRKLTVAVAQVSERDFRLVMDKEDLTVELLPIHDKLTQSLEALRIAFEREKEAIADISHELRTPVAGLMATLDVALRRPRTAEQYQKTLEECRAISKQLAHLVERVMTLAYLDADKSQVTRTDSDAAEVAEGCAAVIRPLSESQNVTFRTEIEGPTTVATDPDKLREVMINLLHNAVEYNRPGGEIELRVRPAKGGGAIVEVADTGIGMSPDVQAKIFERFFRADPSRTQTGVHAGLGLAIVKEYVNRLGGTIAVESQLGKGSTFRVTLPG